jgi:membrane dipeptidase
MASPQNEHSQTVYRQSIVIDGLNVSNWDSPAVYESLQRGGITASNATIAVWEGFAETLDHIAGWQHRFQTYSDNLVKIESVEDIHHAKRENKAGIILGWQNASPIENDLSRLSLFHSLGVRIIQLTYNERNLLGNGCYERCDEGLSHFGVDAVREMNRLGILIDLSHCGDRTTLDAIEQSSVPVAITHANARAFVDFVRNKTDDALRALAERGGVVGAVSFPIFLRKGYESTLSDFGDAIDDLVERIGIDHVGIGNDFCQDQPHRFFEWLFAQQGTKFRPMPVAIADPHHHPHNLELPDQMPNLADELLGRGYGDEDVSKILGGNFFRLFSTAWKNS